MTTKMDAFIMRQSLIEEKVDNHIQEFHDFKVKDQERWDQFIDCQERNTEAIKTLVNTTASVVDAWRVGQNVVKAGSVLGRFIKWLSGVAIVGVGISYLIDNIPWK